MGRKEAMKEKIKLSGVPETMLQTIYARAKESRGRGIIHDAKAEEIIEKLDAVKFLHTEPEVQTITVEGNDIVVGFHGGKDAEAMLLAKLVAHNIGICGFWREPGDLESIFMQITDHDMEKVVMTSEE